jgi:O-Antigen ligase
MFQLTYRKILIALVAATVQSYMLVFLMEKGLISFTVTHAILALGVACLPLLVRPSARDWPWGVTLWYVGFLAVSLAFFVRISNGFESGVQLLRSRMLAAFLLMAVLLILSDRRTHRFAAWTMVVASLTAVALNLYEAFAPGTFSDTPGRSAGFYRNPNISGSALVMGMIVGLYVVGQKWQVPYSLAIGLGILVTFSRSSILAWILITPLTLSLHRGARRLIQLAIVAALVLFPLFLVAQSLIFKTFEDNGALTRDVMSRASMEIGGDSDDSRFTNVRLALESFAAHPLLGKGTGASYEPPFDQVGPHNIYLAHMVDNGILGVLLYPTLIWLATRHAAQEVKSVSVPFAFFLAYWGLFSHNLPEEYHFVFSLAFVSSLVAANRDHDSSPEGGTP